MRSVIRYVMAVLLSAMATTSLIAAAAPQIGAILTAHRSTATMPELNQLAERSVMYDTYGNVIQTFSAAENRKPVSIDDVPQGVIDAVLAVEDEGFYFHHGVNIRSLARATMANVSAGGVVQGGSTITQQVVKLGLVGSERTANRKLREAMYALQLEKRYTKAQILERYLNTVYFGNGAYGVKAAAETFFGKEPTELTAADGAFLAGLIRNPNGYDPFRYPQRFQARRRFALQRLVDTGKMTKLEAEAAASAPLPIKPFITIQRQITQTYFVARARQVLLDDPSILGDTPQQRNSALFTGGLKIYTTFDPLLQAMAENARNELPDTGGRFEAAIASVDSRTGAVKALVGGPGFDLLKFDLATQGRNQAGSSFKTFVLVAALEAGMEPDDLIDGTAGCSFPIQGQAEPYTPSGHGSGIGPVRKMFSSSINCAFVRLGLIVSPEKVVETAEKMGIPKNVLQPYASIALGTFGVSPLNMASAYATLADGGVRHEPFYIERIEDREGRVLYQHSDAGVQAVPPDVAATAVDVMQGVVTGGTGKRAALDGRQVAGKTGTTNNSADVWFVGFTPELSTAVWIGSRYGDTESVKIGGKQQFGGDYPAKLWQAFMSQALTNTPPETFPAPPGPARPPMRLLLPGNECWAKTTIDASTPTIMVGAPGETVVPIPVVSYSKDPPPPVRTAGSSGTSSIAMVPISGYAVARCDQVDLARQAAASTTTTVTPTTIAAETTVESTSTSAPPSG